MMNRGDFIFQNGTPQWVAHEMGMIAKHGDDYTRLDVQQTSFKPHPVVFDHNCQKTIFYVEMMLGRSMTNIERLVFERFKHNDKDGFKNHKGNLKAFLL